MNITQIVPRFPPDIDGVGEYAALLGEALERGGFARVSHINCNPSQGRQAHSQEFLLTHKHKLLALLQESKPDIILLHYVGYGYEQRGCPLWLVRALRTWKKMQDGATRARIPIITIFHELMAFSSPWHSAFWLYPLQRSLVKQLLSLSDGVFVHTEYFASLLRAFHAHAHIMLRPVFSTIGEPQSLPPFQNRQPTLIVFGSQAHRRRIFAAKSAALHSLIATKQISQIYEIGKPFPHADYFHGLPVQSLGLRDAREISQLLAEARFGAVEYAPKSLGKSTVFANFAAHGVCPILVGDGDKAKERDKEDASPEAEYLAERDFLRSGNNLAYSMQEEVVQHNVRYYQENSLERYAQAVKDLLEKVCFHP